MGTRSKPVEDIVQRSAVAENATTGLVLAPGRWVAYKVVRHLGQTELFQFASLIPPP